MKYLKNAYAQKSSSSCWLNFTGKDKKRGSCFIQSKDSCSTDCSINTYQDYESSTGDCDNYMNCNILSIFEVQSTDELSDEFSLIHKIVMTD